MCCLSICECESSVRRGCHISSQLGKNNNVLIIQIGIWSCLGEKNRILHAVCDNRRNMDLPITFGVKSVVS